MSQLSAVFFACGYFIAIMEVWKICILQLLCSNKQSGSSFSHPPIQPCFNFLGKVAFHPQSAASIFVSTFSLSAAMFKSITVLLLCVCVKLQVKYIIVLIIWSGLSVAQHVFLKLLIFSSIRRGGNLWHFNFNLFLKKNCTPVFWTMFIIGWGILEYMRVLQITNLILTLLSVSNWAWLPWEL